jgi:hypothetical protein
MEVKPVKQPSMPDYWRMSSEKLAKLSPEEKIVAGMQIAARGPDMHKRPNGGARQTIAGFTARSKRGLKERFHKINRSLTEHALFLTLTYHANMRDAALSKKQLRAFDKRLHRAYPLSALFWKMECQKRGSIHFHLLVFGVKFIPHEWVAQTWGEIVAPGDEQQLAAGTSIEKAKNFWEARHYLEKYLGKGFEDPELESPGRFWGTSRMERYVSPTVEVELTQQQANTVVRTLDKYQRAEIVKRWQDRCVTHSPISIDRIRRGIRNTADAEYRRALLKQACPDSWMLIWSRRRRRLYCRPLWAEGSLVPCAARWFASIPEKLFAQILCYAFAS